MTEAIRDTVIRIKLQEMEESIGLVLEHLPEAVGAFMALGIVRDGIYKRVEYAIENVFDICAILNTDLHLGIPAADEDILENLVRHRVLSPRYAGPTEGIPKHRRASLRGNQSRACLLDTAGAYRRFLSLPAGGRALSPIGRGGSRSLIGMPDHRGNP